MREILQMSNKELDRVHVIKQLSVKQITQKKAAEMLNLKSERQIRNLLSKYKCCGAKGLISKKRGKSSNRSFDVKFRSQVLALVCEKYPDFGPTFAQEKLFEYHQIKISEETLRKWMIEAGLWLPRKKRSCVHPLRPRREFFGELIQIDGSHHYWFEDRGDKCVLIVFIDDATSKITSLFFCKTECLNGYFSALKAHLLKYGRPLGLYSDRHAIFGGSDKIHHAQFIRALNELGIESVLAGSPQAKGRVERVNQTLQDRLVKEMRLRNICSIEDANNYLPEFIKEFNDKFSKEPRGQIDTHRPLDSDYDLERILTRCEIRTLSKDLSFSFYNTTYQILDTTMVNRLKNKKIEVRQKDEDKIRIFYGKRELNYVPLMEWDKQVLNNKERLFWKTGRGTCGGHPKADHPWKQYPYPWDSSKKVKKEAMI